MQSGKKNATEKGQSRNWYKDRYETVITQRNVLVTVAVVSLAAALVSVIVILLLVPSKTVMPFLIQVDEKTGVTQAIDMNTLKTITADEALRKYFVVKFLRARESYDATDLDVNIDTVRLLSARPIYREYWKEVVDPNNKDSMYVRLASTAIRKVDIKSVQFLDANRAQVRFSTIRKSKSSDRETEEQHYIALVKFQFMNLDLDMEEMMVNPLGFTVEEYKVDEDIAS